MQSKQRMIVFVLTLSPALLHTFPQDQRSGLFVNPAMRGVLVERQLPLVTGHRP